MKTGKPKSENLLTIFIALLCLLTSSKASAKKNNETTQMDKSACGSTVDLRSKMPPIRNQGDIGWCYAHVSADLLSYRYRQNISAADIALKYNQIFMQQLEYAVKGLFSSFTLTPAQTKRDGGYLDLALDNSMKNGFCLEKDLPSNAVNGNLKTIQEFRALEKLIYEIREKTNVAQDCAEHYEKTQKLFPNLTPSEFETILANDGPSKIITDLASVTCKNRQYFKNNPEIDSIKSFAHSDAEIFKIITKQLDKNNILGIEYNTAFLKGQKKPLTRIEKYFGGHASSIIGKRWSENKKTCEFLLRNSYGPSCSYYAEPYKSSCEAGNIWVDSDSILKALSGLVYLK